ncbi:MAG: hypothetical protein HY889_02460 [Deltaproteobacteria bacterium]|nr:hypothetical protein [Deltaproteobacteria bacterium]
MRLKSVVFLALLPVLTACAADCERVIKYEGFNIGKTRLEAPAYIREEKMPISWKLLTDNLPAFVVTSDILKAADETQYSTCLRLKTAPDQDKQALKAKFKQHNAYIDELAEILQYPPDVLPQKLDAWNKKLEYLIKAEKKDETGETKPATDGKAPGAEKPVATKPAPAAEKPSEKAATPAVSAPASEKPADGAADTDTLTSPDTTAAPPAP